MATTVHIPREVLVTVDAMAKKRRMSRNRYIVEALRSQIEAENTHRPIPASVLSDMKQWAKDPHRIRLVKKMEQLIGSSRRSKKMVRL